VEPLTGSQQPSRGVDYSAGELPRRNMHGRRSAAFFSGGRVTIASSGAGICIMVEVPGWKWIRVVADRLLGMPDRQSFGTKTRRPNRSLYPKC
jgi:hypothetical protein